MNGRSVISINCLLISNFVERYGDSSERKITLRKSLNSLVYKENGGDTVKSWIRKYTNTASIRYFVADFVHTPCEYQTLEY